MIWKREKQSNENKSPAEILYGEKTEKQRDKQKLRNRLIKELGNNLSAAQILYGTSKNY